MATRLMIASSSTSVPNEYKIQSLKTVFDPLEAVHLDIKNMTSIMKHLKVIETTNHKTSETKSKARIIDAIEDIIMNR